MDGDLDECMEVCYTAEEEARLHRVRQIITKEFDVEILHKWREIRIIEDELDKGYQLQLLLEKLLLNEQIYGASMERSSSFALSQPVSRLGTPAPSTSGTGSSHGGQESPRRVRQASAIAQSKTGDIFMAEKGSSEPGPLFEVCPDGSIVRLRCPVCGAERFRSILGLVNHCRINCGLLISNPEDRLHHCGILVGPEEVPPEYFVGRGVGQLKRDRDLAAIRAGVQAPIIDPSRRPIIREFSETDTNVVGERVTRSASHQILGSIASSQADVGSLQSRFYIRKRIVIGNWTRSLDTGLEEAEAAQKMIPTHEWRLFVRSFDPADDIASYVKTVRFHLHPSYKPNDVITADGKPFELIMSGWGEFPARVEIIFVDPKNKPAEFIHFLRLRPCHSRISQLMSEQSYDLELDRKQHQKKNSGGKLMAAAQAFEEEAEEHPTRYSVDDALAVASRFFPLFGSIPKSTGSVAPAAPPAYNRAVSYAEFMKLSQFDQQILERERALALQRHLSEAYPELSLEYVLEWCRNNGLSPVIINGVDAMRREDEDASGQEKEEGGVRITEEELTALKYCRYCGLAHFPQDRFEVLQKNCSMRPRKLHLSSRSTVTDLVAGFSLAPDPLPELKKPKLIEPVEPSEVTEAQISQWPAENQWAHHIVAPLELPAYHPRKDTSGALAAATRRFLADLIQRSAQKLPDTIERAVGRPVVLTPVHLYQTITGVTPVSAISGPKDKQEDPSTAAGSATPSTTTPSSKFDFLCNSYMAGT